MATLKLDAAGRAVGKHGMTFVHAVSGDLAACSDPRNIESAAVQTIRNSRELLTEGRGWIGDCFDDADTLTDFQVIWQIAHNYDGGCTAFYLNSRVLTPTITRKA